jgi:hypothetical protein
MTVIAVKKKMKERDFCPVVCRAAGADPKTMSMSRISAGTGTGIDAFGERNMPQITTARSGIPIPTISLAPATLIERESPISECCQSREL